MESDVFEIYAPTKKIIKFQSTFNDPNSYVHLRILHLDVYTGIPTLHYKEPVLAEVLRRDFARSRLKTLAAFLFYQVMSSADTFLQRATVYLEDARDKTQHPSARFDALDASRAALLDARRAQAPPQSLLPIFTGLLTTASSDPSHIVRIAVSQVIEDFCLRDLKSFVPSATQLLLRALHDDHVLVSKRAVRALTTLFRKLIGFVVHVGVGDSFPEASLTIWLQMQARAMSFIHATDEGLRKAATKFAETVVLAFSYSGGGASPEHFTLEYLIKRGSNSALLEVDKLEREGVHCVKAVVQLVHDALAGTLVTKKPDDTPPEHGLPPASFMTAISVLSNLVRRRPKLLEFTLPPLLGIVASITGSRGRPSRVFNALTHSQRGSILMMLKLSLHALRGFSYTRNENWNNEIAVALNDLSASEREQEALRKERTSLPSNAQQRIPKIESVTSAEHGVPSQLLKRSHERPDVPSPAIKPTLPSSASNRPPPQPDNLGMVPGLRLLPDDAFSMAQALVRTMPSQEVVNFVMTRLLLNIPPEETVPGAAEAARRVNKRPLPQSEDPAATLTAAQKKHKRSRFGSKDGAEPAVQPAPVKKVTVRKTMPPVVPAKLSPDAIDRLVILCCRRILTREAETRTSGAAPLRVQLLARILTWLVYKKNKTFTQFCDEACTYIVQHLSESMALAQAWLHCLAVADGYPLSQHIHRHTNGHDDTHSATMETKSEQIQKNPGSFGSNSESNNADIMSGSNDNKMDVDKTENVSAKEQVNTKERDGSPKNQTPEIPDTTMIESGEISEVLEDDDDDSDAENWNNTPYERIFVRILTLLRERLGVSAEILGNFISEAPIIPEVVINIMRGMCMELASVKDGLHTVRAVITERPGKDRSKCLSLLFELACNDDVAVRGPTIRLLANKLFVEGEADVQQFIEERTVHEIQNAVESVRKEPFREHVKILECMSLLTTALCGQKHDLVRHLCEAFKNLPREGKEVVKKQVMDLAEHIGLEANPLTDLIGGTLLVSRETSGAHGKKSDGVEELALAVLRSGMRKTGTITPFVVQAAMQRYKTCGDMEFLLTVIEGLSREEVLKHLEAIVEYTKETSTNGDQQSAKVNANHAIEDRGNMASMETPTGKDVFKDMIGKLTSSKVNIRPADMLVELHKLRPTTAVGFAIQQCFELKSVFKQEAVAQAVQQVLDMTITPDMLMRTVILARLFYPEMEGYLTDTVMTGLIAKKVWTNAVLWDGFLRYCVDVKKSAVKLLLSLPVSQLEDALLKKEELRAFFRDMNKSNTKNVRKIPTKHRKVILSVLKQSSSDK